MTQGERALCHQIHPVKLSTDVAANLVSLYFFWQHRLWVGIVLHFVPPIVASILIMRLANLERLRESPLGAYLKRAMTRTVEAVRLFGDIVMVVAAWYRAPAFIFGGLLIIVGAWLSGLGPRLARRREACSSALRRVTGNGGSSRTWGRGQGLFRTVSRGSPPSRRRKADDVPPLLPGPSCRPAKSLRESLHGRRSPRSTNGRSP